MPGGDPWNARTLEWSIPCPAPHYNYAVLPVVHARDAFHAAKAADTAYPLTRDYEDIEMPRNTGTGVVMGVALAAACFGLVWWMWWLAVAGLVVAVGAVVARSFATDTLHRVPAAEVRRQDQAWLAFARALPCTGLRAYAVIGAAALVQVAVHFRFFLHIGLGRSTRDDLQLILFTALIIVLMVGGTLWILGNLHARMM